MSTKKKNKLSLKKTAAPKSGSSKPVEAHGQTTILSMFKRQRERQIVDIDSDVDEMESKDQTKDRGSDFQQSGKDEGSEGDVVISKIESSTSDTFISMNRETRKPGNERQVNVKKNLSLRKAKKRKSQDLDEGDEFMPSKSKSKKDSKLSKSGDTSGRYNPRKSKTEPLIEESDSDDGLTIVRIEEKRTGADNNSSQKENLKSGKDTDTVLPNKETKYKNTKSKLSLKKCKTESDLRASRDEAKVKRNRDKIFVDLSDSSESDTKITGDHMKTNKKSLKSLDDNDVAETKEVPNNGKFTEKNLTYTNKRSEADNGVKCDNESVPSKYEINEMKDIEETQTYDKIKEKNNINPQKDMQSTEMKSKTEKEPLTTFSIFKPQKSKKDNVTKTAANRNKSTSDAVADNDDSDDDSKADFLPNIDEPGGETGTEQLYKVPYYLENFRTILQTVLEDIENARLFDDTDMKHISAFNSLDEAAQKLYIRLFSRRLAWLPLSKISYPEISVDIESLLDDLVEAKLIISGEELEDISQILPVMAAPDLKTLAKTFHLNITGVTKKQIVQMLIKKSQQSSISSLFKGGGNVSTEKTMVTRAKSYLGRICRLHDESRAVFIRTLMLFSLYNTNLDEESGGRGQNQLFQMLMANIGRVVYPSYTVNRQTPVFRDRAAVIRFETALMCELDIQTKTEKNKWTEAYDVYQQAKQIGKDVCSNKEYLDWNSKLPLFLRSYTAGTVYIRIDNQGVEILQRLKKYKEAVILLEELLSQGLYCPEYRGHWYDRLALNLDAHLKSQAKCLEVIKTGLADREVRPSRRYLLYQRAEKICGGPNSKYADKLTSIEPVRVTEAPEHYIEGMVMPDAGSIGMNYKFVLEGGDEGVTLCAVEELALDHYRQNGYPEGLHAEGSIISNLFLMFFWEIEFMDVPDVFHSPYQTHPLDMMTTDFYASRQQHIDDRLKWLRTSETEALMSEVGAIWEKYNGTMCSGINWEKFSGPQKLQGLVSCMGGQVIAGILERYVKDPRHTRSGFPDLTLWNTDNKTFKISEVKGPGDRLSHKQILWLDYLLSLGVDAEVCYVKAVGSKKLKPSTKSS